MLELLARSFPLMVAAAANPVVITLIVLVLTAPDRPLARAWSFFAGFASVLIVAGVLFLTVFANHTETFGPRGTLYGWIDIGFGALMLGAAVLTFVRRGGEAGASRLIGRIGPLACFGLGAVMMASDTSAIAAYVPLLHEISNAGLARADRVVALAISDLVILAPLGIPILVRTLAPDRATRVLEAIRRFLDRYGAIIAALVFAALGALLMIRGIDAPLNLDATAPRRRSTGRDALRAHVKPLGSASLEFTEAWLQHRLLVKGPAAGSGRGDRRGRQPRGGFDLVC